MITLYQLHWSHYVEKVRWALDFKRLAWSAVDVDPFTKRQLRRLGCKVTLDSGGEVYTVPAIHDHATDTIVSDSTRILDYLERTYPSFALYGSEARAQDEVRRWMLWLDSTVGLAARRLAYTQIALEHPGIIAGLFLPDRVGSGGLPTLKARLAGAMLAGVLSQRFRFLHNREDRVFEDLEQTLLAAARRLRSRSYLVDDQFTAADLTLCALSRPALLVPFFRDHPDLKGLWEWRSRLLEQHQREPEAGYEAALHDIRRRRGWALGRVSWMEKRGQAPAQAPPDIPSLSTARNDQQPLGRLPLVGAPFRYLRLKATNGLGRAAY